MKLGVPSAPGLADALDAVFLEPPCRRDAPYAGAVEARGLDPDHLFPLQVPEHTVQDAVLRPPVHARVDGVPVAEVLRLPCVIRTADHATERGVISDRSDA